MTHIPPHQPPKKLIRPHSKSSRQDLCCHRRSSNALCHRFFETDSLCASSLDSTLDSSCSDVEQCERLLSEAESSPDIARIATGRKTHTPTSLDRLCGEFDLLHVRKDTNPAPFNQPDIWQLPLHDRRIIQRMAAKRQDFRRRQQLANNAHESWQRDQYERRVNDQQRAERIARAAETSRRADQQRLHERRRSLWQRDRHQTQTVRSLLEFKDLRVANQLDSVREARERRAKDRCAGEMLRCAAVGWRRNANDRDRRRRTLDCAVQLDDRLGVAARERERLTESYRLRVGLRNVAELEAHADRLRGVREMERERLDGYRRRWVGDLHRGEDWVRMRTDGIMEQRRRAFWTAELREMVRTGGVGI